MKAGEDEFTSFSYHGEVFDLPYRCLVPLGVDQLLVAGRSISASHDAQGAIRTSPTCMAMGQAAGVAAVQALREEVAPRLVNTDRLRQTLAGQGVLLGEVGSK